MSASLPAATSVTMPMKTPIVATVNPVCACVTSRTTATAKIALLIAKSRLFSMASLGFG